MKSRTLNTTELAWNFWEIFGKDNKPGDGLWVNLQHDCWLQKQFPKKRLYSMRLVTSIVIVVGDNGHGFCQMHYDFDKRFNEVTHAGEFCGCHENAMKEALEKVFFDKGNRSLRGVGCGCTTIRFEKKRGEHMTTTAMTLFKDLARALDINEYELELVGGPRVSRRNYSWRPELEGWIAFEDILAAEHGLRPRNRPLDYRSSRRNIEPFNDLTW